MLFGLFLQKDLMMEIVTVPFSSSSSSCGGTFYSLRFKFCLTRQWSPIACWRLFYRDQVDLPNKLVLCLCKAKLGDSPGDASGGVSTAPTTGLAAERDEARAILSQFLTKQGASNAAAADTVNRSDRFVDHLVSKLHYVGGGKLTSLGMRGVLVPYMESLREEYGSILIDVVENFPDHHGEKRVAVANQPVGRSSKKERAMAHASEQEFGDPLPPQVLYLLDLGLSMEQIKSMARRQPFITCCSLEHNVKPIVKFLLDLGIAHKDIPTIFLECPSLSVLRIKENLLPKMKLLEGLGIKKDQWSKVICRYPGMLTFSKHKITAIVDYLSEMNISDKDIGKILTRFPNIVGCHVDMKLRPIDEYLQSFGIDSAAVMCKSPQAFGLSLEGSIKPTTEFFLDKGFTIEEIGIMFSRFGNLYTLSLEKNLALKWEFFLTMDYPRSDLVKCPQFFGYSLKKRIEPRYNLIREHNVKWKLGTWLSVSQQKFERILENYTKAGI